MDITVVNVSIKSLRPNYNSLSEWLLDKNHVYIGSPVQWVKGATSNIWENPFSTESFGLTRSLVLYESYVLGTPALRDELISLQGKSIGCWFDSSSQCHGHVLKKLVEENLSHQTANPGASLLKTPSHPFDRKTVYEAKRKYFEDMRRSKSSIDIIEIIQNVDRETHLKMYKLLTDMKFDTLSPSQQQIYIT